MPEYLALLHHHNLANEDGGEPEPPSPEDVNAMFLRMERSGIGKVH